MNKVVISACCPQVMYVCVLSSIWENEGFIVLNVAYKLRELETNEELKFIKVVYMKYLLNKIKFLETKS